MTNDTVAETTRILVFESDPGSRDQLISLIEGDPGASVIGAHARISDGLIQLSESFPDLVFLDLDQAGDDALDLVGAGAPGYAPALVVTSQSEIRALEAFELRALDYLIKPFCASRVRRSLLRFRSYRAALAAQALNVRLMRDLRETPSSERYLRRVAVPASRGGFGLLDVSSIDWIDAAGNYLLIHASGDRHKVRETMTAFEQRLDPSTFVRVHRSTIVNLAAIREVRKRSFGEHLIVTKSGQRLNVGRRYRERVAQVLGRPRTSVRAREASSISVGSSAR